MSRWFADTIRVALDPDQVVIHHRPGGWLRGARRRVVREPVPLTTCGRDAPAWAGAMGVLTSALARLGEVEGRVTVILANSFVRYVLIPQSSALTAEQEAAVLQYGFRDIFGITSDDWELRLSAVSGVSSQPASGVDRDLLDALRAVLNSDRLRLQSIQPRLMAVCNQHGASMKADLFWLLLVEPGTLCLGLVSNGCLVHLRSLRCGDNWYPELSWLLGREACLAGLDAVPANVLLWRREGAMADPDTDRFGEFRLQWLRDPAPIVAVSDDESATQAG